jgi:hypothetical protein
LEKINNASLEQKSYCQHIQLKVLRQAINKFGFEEIHTVYMHTFLDDDDVQNDQFWYNPFLEPIASDF